MIAHKFTSLHYTIHNARNILLVAHSRPDPDTIGANIALYHYIKSQNIPVTLTCVDDFPDTFNAFLPRYTLKQISQLDIDAFDVIIGSDNIDRGFDTIIKQVNTHNCVTIGIDHHPHTAIHPDILITRPHISSTCEILYDFFTHIKHRLTQKEASALAIGILGDTRIFHNANTSPHTIEIIGDLLSIKAPISKIIRQSFLTKRLETLKLWGIALKKAQRLTPSGAIVSIITDKHICNTKLPQKELKEELKEVASLLSSVPNVPFSMILIQIGSIVKGSIRAEKDRNIDTAHIAALLGGGGHKLASGFEVHGKLLTTKDGLWQIT